MGGRPELTPPPPTRSRSIRTRLLLSALLAVLTADLLVERLLRAIVVPRPSDWQRREKDDSDSDSYPLDMLEEKLHKRFKVSASHCLVMSALFPRCKDLGWVRAVQIYPQAMSVGARVFNLDVWSPENGLLLTYEVCKLIPCQAIA